MTNRELQHILKSVEEAQNRANAIARSPATIEFLRQAADTQKRVEAAINSPGVTEFLRQAVDTQKRVQAAINSPGVTEFLRQAADTQKRVQGVIGSPDVTAFVRRMAEVTARAMQALREWDEAERQAIELLTPRGWLISPSTSLSEIHALLRTAEEEGIDRVEEALVAALNPRRCREIIGSLYDRDSFTAWRPVFEQALDAHESGNYALAIPIWLMAFDGIFSAELDIDQVFSRVRRRRGSRIRSALTGASGRLLDALIGVILFVGEQVPHGPPPSDGQLRRNIVMHGLDPTFGTEKASCQGILLLESLHYHLDQHYATADQP